MTIPEFKGSIEKALCKAALMVLLCTELNARPNVTVISTAKSTPIQRFFNPRSM